VFYSLSIQILVTYTRAFFCPVAK